MLIARRSKLASLMIMITTITIMLLMQTGLALAATVATPSISPGGGAFTAAQSVTVLNIPGGDTVYYTIDGSDPTTSNTRSIYSGAFTVSQSETVKVAILDPAGWSSIATATFTIGSGSSNSSLYAPTVETGNAATLTSNSAILSGSISNNGSDTISEYGFYLSTDENQWVKITAGTDNHYGSFNYNPTGLAAATKYYFKAYATNPGGTAYGNEISFTTLDQDALPTAPTISPGGGSFTTAQSVTILDIPSGDTAYYTTDGSDPSTSSTAVAYSGAFAVSQSETVQAAARGSAGWSSIASAVFTINGQTEQETPVPPASQGGQITQLKQEFADAISGNQMEQAAQILKQIEAINKAEDNMASLEEQLIAALNGSKWSSAEAVLKMIINTANPDWAYSELGQIYKQQGNKNISVFANGDELDFDVQPIIVDGRTLVPIRTIANALGLPDSDVGWSEDGTVTINAGSDKITISNNALQVYLNGNPYNIDVPAQIVDGRMMVPLRVISQLFNKNVQWYPVGQIVEIS